jgi:hypothetical protein
MGKPEHRGRVWIRQSSDGLECDVIVSIRGNEMVVQLPDYSQAVKWAQMESKSYGIPAIDFRQPNPSTGF